MTSRRAATGAVKLAVSGGILALILHRLPLAELGASLRSADPAYVAGALVLMAPLIALAAVQFRILTRGQGMGHSLGELFRINVVAEFYRVFLPGDLAGGVVRWHRLSRAEGQRAQAFAVIAYNRLVELAGTTLLGLVFWALDPRARESRLVPLAFGLVLATLLAVRTVLFTRGAAAVAVRLLHRVPAGGRIGGAAARLRKVVRSCAAYQSMPASWQAGVVGVSMAKHLIGLSSLWLLALSLGLGVTWAEIGWVRSAVLLVTVLPITISGFGLREGSFLVLLEPYGVSGAQAVALSLLFYARNLVAPVLGGALEGWTFLRSGRRPPAGSGDPAGGGA